MTLLVDGEKDGIEMPLITGAWATATELVRIRWPQLLAPIAHGLVCAHDTAFRHERFDSAVAQAAAAIQPHTVADDLCGKAMALIRVRWWCMHAASLPHEGRSGKGEVHLTMP
jgi:hypothetical protein